MSTQEKIDESAWSYKTREETIKESVDGLRKFLESRRNLPRDMRIVIVDQLAKIATEKLNMRFRVNANLEMIVLLACIEYMEK